MHEERLPAALRQRLSRYQLVSPRRGAHSSLQGVHRGRRRGRSLEFAEHRDYVSGDDLRHLDWNAFARHEKLVVKEFESELERVVLVVVDLSESMGPLKRQRALQAAAALAWVGLLGHDRVALATLGARPGFHPAVRGRAAWGRLTDWLWQQPVGGRAGLVEGLRGLAQRLPRHNLMLILSDWLEPQAWEGLAYPQFCRHELRALQLLDSEDRLPPWSGPLELQDCESGELRQIHLEEATRQLYLQALEGHVQELSQACQRRGFSWLSWQAEQPLESLLLQAWVQQGWLR